MRTMGASKSRQGNYLVENPRGFPMVRRGFSVFGQLLADAFGLVVRR